MAASRVTLTYTPHGEEPQVVEFEDHVAMRLVIRAQRRMYPERTPEDWARVDAESHRRLLEHRARVAELERKERERR